VEEAALKPKNRLPVAQELGETSLMFLVHPTLTDAEIEKTCRVVAEVMELAV
jgi:dTDP-4-amino-4,6-dideoxygalactose transaminase